MFPNEKPADVNGHTWEFIPYAKGTKGGSFRCSTCLTSYSMGNGRNFQCDKGEGFRRDVKNSLKKAP